MTMKRAKVNTKMLKIDSGALKTGWRKCVKYIIGKEADKGLIFKIFIYLILIDTAFIYLNPILSMATTMIMGSNDLIDPSVIWVPTKIYLGALQDAWVMLEYPKSFLISVSMSSTIAVFQTLMCAVAGYAFARLEFPFKKTLFFCLLLSLIVPPQIITIPNLLMARELGTFTSIDIINTYKPIIFPSMFGHGLKGALFVIIFRQFFSTQPKELEEAARIDGAHVFKIFYKVMMPLAKPAIVVVFLFSFIWSWNDFYYPGIYLTSNPNIPLSLGIAKISTTLAELEAQFGPSLFNNPIKMAASFLIILPPIILFIFTQKWFVEGVERTGLVE